MSQSLLHSISVQAGLSTNWEKERLSTWVKSLDETLSQPDGLESVSQLLSTIRDNFLQKRSDRLYGYNQLPKENLTDYLVRSSKDKNTFKTPVAGAVFTAHPTFSISNETIELILDKGKDKKFLKSHRRPAPPTLEEENSLSLAAIQRGRAALDKITTDLIKQLAKTDKVNLPKLMTFATWVGFDTDGRNDISCWTAFQFRLLLKIAHLEYLKKALSNYPDKIDRLEKAIEATKAQEMAISVLIDEKHNAENVQKFCETFFKYRDEALLNIDGLNETFGLIKQNCIGEELNKVEAIETNALSHGLGLAQVHFRLNAAQIYNVVRTRLGLTDDPAIPLQRASLIREIEGHLKDTQKLSVNFGTLLFEPSAASRLMMVVTQILKHIDSKTPIRFLIAETEYGYTLLATLWLAKLFGIDSKQIEISPLFETRSALENGSEILEEAFASPSWREYIRENGKLCLQFGYSDSGRYIGQLGTTPFIQKIKAKAYELLNRYSLDNVSLVFFDTHGEGIGRGAHPTSLTHRLEYFSDDNFFPIPADGPKHTINQETAFQGGDGYILFGSDEMAYNAVSSIILHGWKNNLSLHEKVTNQKSNNNFPDLFSVTAQSMDHLLHDKGYGKILGSFGFGLVDKTGSRPSARQAEGTTLLRPSSPTQMRAIPNNAILLQLGWWANIIYGLGEAASKHPDSFKHLFEKDHPYHKLLDFITYALKHSDIDVLKATASLLDPGAWLDDAAKCSGSKRSSDILIAQELEKMEFWNSVPGMFRKIHEDYLKLEEAWTDLPRMDTNEKLIHAIRISLIHKLWKLVTEIPYFGPRNSINRRAIIRLVISLEVPRALELLRELFPLYANTTEDFNFCEEGGAETSQGFEKENKEIFDPMEQCFNLIRECSIALIHANGFFG